jgi:hypothetical protein
MSAIEGNIFDWFRSPEECLRYRVRVGSWMSPVDEVSCARVILLMEADRALRYQPSMPEINEVPTMNLRRFVWCHGLDHRSLFDNRADLARPFVPYPLLAAWDSSPSAVVDVYWRCDRRLYLSVDRQRWKWCAVCPGQRWISGKVSNGIPEMPEFQKVPTRRLRIKEVVRVLDSDSLSLPGC